MRSNPQEGRFRRDSRGNLLEDWDVLANRHGPGHLLRLRGPSEVVRQVTLLTAYDCLPVDVVEGSKFTHALSSNEPFNPRTEDLLRVLAKNLSLPNPPGVHATIALDWYKAAEDGVPPDQWTYTDVGGLVHKGKYSKRFANQQQVALAGRRLTALLFGMIRKHQLLNATELVLDVPGHDSKFVSLGSSLADGVAQKLGVEFVRVSCKHDYRTPIKNLPAKERSELLRDEFSVRRDLSGKPVLIIDDMFQTGTSMAAVAKAARHAGARLVYGVTATRTLKRGI